MLISPMCFERLLPFKGEVGFFGRQKYLKSIAFLRAGHEGFPSPPPFHFQRRKENGSFGV